MNINNHRYIFPTVYARILGNLLLRKWDTRRVMYSRYICILNSSSKIESRDKSCRKKNRVGRKN